MKAEEIPEHILPPTGYSLQEIEQLLGWPRRTAYRKVREGKVDIFYDGLGQMKVHPYTLWQLLEEQEDK